ncbi:MAG: N-acetylglucosamine-6-phosphate deacetylase [Chloroflexota bacterium]|nr:N-acetylglucosamine-6-phosphate deacetylase [Chloroflexota bacterium]
MRISGDRISEVGSGPTPRDAAERHELPGRWLVPGFIDLHVHGGGGHAMLSSDPADIRSAAAFHRSHGTTTSLASIVTAPLEEMLAGVAAVRDVVRSVTTPQRHVIGSHLEGPFLNPRRAGAHDPRHLLPPDPAALDRLLEVADGTLRVITLAPELPGGVDLVRRAVAAGVIVAVGHSDADHAQAMAAFDAGASLVTHLFNGMAPFHHREPGLVGAALADHRVVCEVINDGVHLHDAAVRLAFEAAGSGRIALVTDAIAAAGAGDGQFQLGPATVRVLDGEVRLDGERTLAGSTLTMDVALRRAVRTVRLPIAAAVEAASATPARLLGIGDSVGSIEVGHRADLVVLSDRLEVEAVMAAGEWTPSGRLVP